MHFTHLSGNPDKIIINPIILVKSIKFKKNISYNNV